MEIPLPELKVEQLRRLRAEYAAESARLDTIMTVGSSGGGSRGEVIATWDGTDRPGLIVLEADDGTPLFLSAWAVGGGQYELRGSLTLPTSPSAGSLIVDL